MNNTKIDICRKCGYSRDHHSDRHAKCWNNGIGCFSPVDRFEPLKDGESFTPYDNVVTSVPLRIPKDWTFATKEVAANFDAHVREQLPWYEQATRAVAHIGRHYIPESGLVYDIGASTGNISAALLETSKSRKANIIAIENSDPMFALLEAKFLREENVITRKESAQEFDYDSFDFAVCFLTLMFIPIADRSILVSKLIEKIKPGGALVVVDKCVTPSGYIGTVLRRLALAWKLEGGASADDILKKELSLAGYQRPINPDMFNCIYHEFFRFGEFAGWVIEREE